MASPNTSDDINISVSLDVSDVEASLRQLNARITQGINGSVAAINRLQTNAINPLDKGIRRTNGALADTFATLRRIGTAFVGFSLFREFERSLKSVISFNSQVEQMRLGIAEVLSVAGRFTDVLGHVLKPAQQINISFQRADQVMQRLIKDSIAFGIPLAQVSEAFNITAAAAASAGIKLNDQVRITESLVVLAQRLNIPFNTLATTIDNIFSGLNVQRTVIGNILGLTETAIRNYRSQGILGEKLIAQLETALHVIPENTKTFEGLANSIRSVIQALSLTAGGGFFDEIKDVVRSIQQSLVALSKDENRVQALNNTFRDIARNIRFTADSIGFLIKQFRDLPGSDVIQRSALGFLAGRFVGGGGRNGTLAGGIVGATAGVAPDLTTNALLAATLVGPLKGLLTAVGVRITALVGSLGLAAAGTTGTAAATGFGAGALATAGTVIGGISLAVLAPLVAITAKAGIDAYRAQRDSDRDNASNSDVLVQSIVRETLPNVLTQIQNARAVGDKDEVEFLTDAVTNRLLPQLNERVTSLRGQGRLKDSEALSSELGNFNEQIAPFLAFDPNKIRLIEQEFNNIKKQFELTVNASQQLVLNQRASEEIAKEQLGVLKLQAELNSEIAESKDRQFEIEKRGLDLSSRTRQLEIQRREQTLQAEQNRLGNLAKLAQLQLREADRRGRPTEIFSAQDQILGVAQAEGTARVQQKGLVVEGAAEELDLAGQLLDKERKYVNDILPEKIKAQQDINNLRIVEAKLAVTIANTDAQVARERQQAAEEFRRKFQEDVLEKKAGQLAGNATTVVNGQTVNAGPVALRAKQTGDEDTFKRLVAEFPQLSQIDDINSQVQKLGLEIQIQKELLESGRDVRVTKAKLQGTSESLGVITRTVQVQNKNLASEGAEEGQQRLAEGTNNLTEAELRLQSAREDKAQQNKQEIIDQLTLIQGLKEQNTQTIDLAQNVSDLLGSTLSGDTKFKDSFKNLSRSVGKQFGDNLFGGIIKDKVGKLDLPLQRNFLRDIPGFAKKGGQDAGDQFIKQFSGKIFPSATSPNVSGLASAIGGLSGSGVVGGAVVGAPGAVSAATTATGGAPGGVASKVGGLAGGAAGAVPYALIALAAIGAFTEGLSKAKAKARELGAGDNDVAKAAQVGAVHGALDAVGLGGLGSGLGKLLAKTDGALGTVIDVIFLGGLTTILKVAGVFQAKQRVTQQAIAVGKLFKDIGIPKTGLGRRDIAFNEDEIGLVLQNAGRSNAGQKAGLGVDLATALVGGVPGAGSIFGTIFGGKKKPDFGASVFNIPSAIAARLEQVRDEAQIAGTLAFINIFQGKANAKELKGLGGKGGIPTALISTANELKLSVEDAQALIDRFTTAVAGDDPGKQILQILDTLRKSRLGITKDKAQITETDAALAITGLVDAAVGLPAVVDKARLSLEVFSEDGVANVNAVTRAAEDLTSVFSGIGKGIADSIKSGDITKGATTLADTLSNTFINRISERLLQDGVVGKLLTDASINFTSAAGKLVEGDKAGFEKDISAGRASFLQAQSTFLKLSGAITPLARGAIFSINPGFGGEGGGIVNQGGIGLPSFATDTIKHVPGGRGRPLLSINHGEEVIRSPDQEDKLLNAVNRTNTLLERGQGNQPIIIRNHPASIVLEGTNLVRQIKRIDERERPGFRVPNPSIGLEVG